MGTSSQLWSWQDCWGTVKKTLTKVEIVGAKEEDSFSDWLLDDERKRRVEKAPT